MTDDGRCGIVDKVSGKFAFRAQQRKIIAHKSGK